MSKSVDFEHSIGDKVKIVGIDVTGFVVGLFYGETGRQYQTAYFIDGEMKTIYLYEFQIYAANINHPIGLLP
jgi:hypothetical protein